MMKSMRPGVLTILMVTGFCPAYAEPAPGIALSTSLASTKTTFTEVKPLQSLPAASTKGLKALNRSAFQEMKIEGRKSAEPLVIPTQRLARDKPTPVTGRGAVLIFGDGTRGSQRPAAPPQPEAQSRQGPPG